MPRAKSTSFRLDTIVTPPGIYINAIIILGHSRRHSHHYWDVRRDVGRCEGKKVGKEDRFAVRDKTAALQDREKVRS